MSYDDYEDDDAYGDYGPRVRPQKGSLGMPRSRHLPSLSDHNLSI